MEQRAEYEAGTAPKPKRKPGPGRPRRHSGPGPVVLKQSINFASEEWERIEPLARQVGGFSAAVRLVIREADIEALKERA